MILVWFNCSWKQVTRIGSFIVSQMSIIWFCGNVIWWKFRWFWVYSGAINFFCGKGCADTCQFLKFTFEVMLVSFFIRRFRLPGSQSLKIPRHCKSFLITMQSLNPLYQRRLVFIHLLCDYWFLISCALAIEWLVNWSKDRGKSLVFWMDIMFFLYWPTIAWFLGIGEWIFWVASHALLQKLCKHYFSCWD